MCSCRSPAIRTHLLLVLVTAVSFVRPQSTPVIGGPCKLGSADVNIGGKQTQFYLHCEPEDPSKDMGVWVVKTRGRPISGSHNLPYEEPTQYHPKKSEKLPSTPIICEQLQAQEHAMCNIPETCLQPNFEDPNTYLQCNPVTRKWTKKNCQPGFWFNFEHQSCVAHAAATARTFRQHVARKTPMHQYSNNGGGLVCTFSQCSPSNPCQTGTCNNGYCCSSPSLSSGLAGLRKRSFNQSMTNLLTNAVSDWPAHAGPPAHDPLRPLGQLLVTANGDGLSCAAGFTSALPCGRGLALTCPPGLFCDRHIRMCCPMLLPLSQLTTTTALPSKSSHVYHHYPRLVGSDGKARSAFDPNFQHHSFKQRRSMSSFPCPGCSQFYNYDSGCAGGTSGGACVSGQCGSGYSCNSNNVCCAQVVPATVCPDGTQAAGACVNNMCGEGFTCNQGLCCTNTSQTPRCLDGSPAIGACMQGKCGSGYTCTTGNICCPSTLITCPEGQESIGDCVNGRCPDGYNCIRGQCCGPPQSQGQGVVSCPEEDSNGPCTSSGTCPEPGYQCDTTNNWCCPMALGSSVGPCIAGAGGTRLCPEGYACKGAGVGQCYRLDTGTCAPEDQFGPCGANNQCPPNYTCIGGFCCRNGSFRRKKRSSFLVDYFTH